MKKIISICILLLMLSACGDRKFETIDTNRAVELINENAIIIDVREVEEYNREHIPNAINIPLSEIDTISYNKNDTIIVYCQSGMRSLEAVKILADMGYTSLYNLDGGLLNWGGSLEE